MPSARYEVVNNLNMILLPNAHVTFGTYKAEGTAGTTYYNPATRRNERVGATPKVNLDYELTIGYRTEFFVRGKQIHWSVFYESMIYSSKPSKASSALAATITDTHSVVGTSLNIEL